LTIGYLFLFSSLIGFGLLGIFHKVADHPNCRPRMVTMLLLFWGAVLTAIFTKFFEPKGLTFPPKVLAIGAAGGLLASLALFSFQASLRFGKISTSWLILNLCTFVPVVLSILIYRERVTTGKAIGLLLVLLAIFLLWWDKKTDLERAGKEATRDPEPEAAAPPLQTELELEGAGGGGTMTAVVAAPRIADTAAVVVAAATPRQQLKSKSKWLPLIMLAFLANGLAATSQKVLVEVDGRAYESYAWQFYIALYAAGFAFCAVVSLTQQGRPNLREMVTGLVMAVASVAGNVSIVMALGKNVPSTVAYPVANGGSLFLVVLAGLLLFKEHVNSVGLAGIAVGIAAILVLVMS
jgi:drug/metabolite transporter (DMT)-like permease